MSASHGRIAIGILIMQDILAVIFLTFSSGKMPSPWAFALILLIFVPQIIKKYPLFLILNKSGHGELLVLLGVFIPFAGALLFIQVGLKPDLGALVFGIMLAGHPKAKELNKALHSFKDLFLVGFFLTIGLFGTPTLEALGISFLFTLAVPVKVALFFLLLTRFKLRARTATLSSISLANYSEFGLIVGAAGVANGWLAAEWLLIFTLSLSITLIIASPLNMTAQTLYSRWQTWLQRFETKTRLPEDEQIELRDAQVIVLGMGRVGTEVYNTLSEKYKQLVLGIDYDKEEISRQLLAKRPVIYGDATDLEFWQRIPQNTNVRLIFLATSNHLTHLQVTKQIRKSYKKVLIAGLSRYNDEIEELKETGVQVVFNPNNSGDSY